MLGDKINKRTKHTNQHQNIMFSKIYFVVVLYFLRLFLCLYDVGDNVGQWCCRPFCYIDPDTCDGSETPFFASYLQGYGGGGTLYYSYDLCNGEGVSHNEGTYGACESEDNCQCRYEGTYFTYTTQNNIFSFLLQCFL